MQVLFARHRTPVYRWLYRFVGNETVAEDLLSDVFFDVWQQAGRFEGRSAVSTWLLSIARFKALSARRRRTHAELDEVIEATVADSADNAEVVLEKKHQGEMLRDALTKLSPEHREIIDLVYYHEKSVDEARRNPQHPGRYREDPYVLCPQKVGRAGPGGIKQRNQLPRRRIEGHDLVGHVPPYPAKLI